MAKRIAVLSLVLTLLANLWGCKEDAQYIAPNAVSFSQEEPLMAEVESREEAEEIAELYGITLVRYDTRLATFYTQEDPLEVIRRGEEQGWPQLSLNTVQKAMD